MAKKMTWGVETTTFTHNGQDYRVTSWKRGDLEVYRIGDDGLEMFLGYVHEKYTAHELFRKAAAAFASDVGYGAQAYI